MTPYYSHGGITIYHHDSAAVVFNLLKFDLLLTDPPYGINYRSTHNSGWRSNRTSAMWRKDGDFDSIAGDDRPIDPAPLLTGQKHAIFGGNYCADKLPASRCWIVWDKNCGKTPSNQADCELIWTDFDKPARVFSHLWRGIMREGEENVSLSPKLHPHQKPLALCRFIIDYSGIQEGIVLDPYCGSGSTLVAAKQRNLQAIGIEIEEKYCEIAAQRLAQGVLAL